MSSQNGRSSASFTGDRSDREHFMSMQYTESICVCGCGCVSDGVCQNFKRMMMADWKNRKRWPRRTRRIFSVLLDCLVKSVVKGVVSTVVLVVVLSIVSIPSLIPKSIHSGESSGGHQTLLLHTPSTSSTSIMPIIWDTSSFLSPASASSSSSDSGSGSTSTSKGLIILNLPITKPEIFYRVWQSCQVRYCADGGANRLFDFFDNDKERSRYLPNLIKGDLDSLRSDVRSWYEQAGVQVIHDPDQYSTDLMKCISSLQAHEKATSTNFDIILFGGLTGRLDQTIHTLHYLHKLRTERDKVWVVSDDEVAWCLDSGEHEIPIDHHILGPTCGILPLGVTDAVITTKGLRWDVENWETSFSTQISTSNQLVSTEPVVRIKTNRPVWWNVAIQDLTSSN